VKELLGYEEFSKKVEYRNMQQRAESESDDNFNKNMIHGSKQYQFKSAHKTSKVKTMVQTTPAKKLDFVKSIILPSKKSNSPERSLSQISPIKKDPSESVDWDYASGKENPPKKSSQAHKSPFTTTLANQNFNFPGERPSQGGPGTQHSSVNIKDFISSMHANAKTSTKINFSTMNLKIGKATRNRDSTNNTVDHPNAQNYHLKLGYSRLQGKKKDTIKNLPNFERNLTNPNVSVKSNRQAGISGIFRSINPEANRTQGIIPKTSQKMAHSTLRTDPFDTEENAYLLTDDFAEVNHLNFGDHLKSKIKKKTITEYEAFGSPTALFYKKKELARVTQDVEQDELLKVSQQDLDSFREKNFKNKTKLDAYELSKNIKMRTTG
jgi:hypothetical protein